MVDCYIAMEAKSTTRTRPGARSPNNKVQIYPFERGMAGYTLWRSKSEVITYPDKVKFIPGFGLSDPIGVRLIGLDFTRCNWV